MATSPITELRAAVKAIITAEFGSEFTVKDGRLHPAHPGPTIGIWPGVEREGRLVLDQESTIQVQVFMAWVAQPRPDYVVDPALIEAVMERFREAFYTATHPRAGTSTLWDFRVIRVDYEADPIGQVTRATATITGIGNNLAETTA